MCGGPDDPNPTEQEIEEINRIKTKQEKAERDTKAAKEETERIRVQLKKIEENAKALEVKADKAAEQAKEQTLKMKADTAEANRRAWKAGDDARAAAASFREDAAKLAQQAVEERERAKRAEERARLAEVAAREEAVRAQRVAEEERRRADDARARAERAAQTAAEETKRAVAAREEAERRWRQGIQPVVTPTLEELERTKRRLQYQEGKFHFAIAGIAGCGKSSLINALRGMHNNEMDRGAAATGVTETTREIGRYPDRDPQHPFIWYDVPGAGTQRIADWLYFNEQGLYIFDCIIVLFDNRFTITDIAILTNARRFNIPTYIVRSKADQHIRNVMQDMGYDSDEDEDEDPGRRARLYRAAHSKYIEETRESARANLEHANLPEQRVYIVSKDNMLNIVRGRRPNKAIDELELVTDLFTHAHARRSRNAPSQ